MHTLQIRQLHSFKITRKGLKKENCGTLHKRTNPQPPLVEDFAFHMLQITKMIDINGWKG